MFFVSTNFTTSGIVKDSYAFFTTFSKSSFDKKPSMYGYKRCEARS